MKVLVACEYSGVVRNAFKAKGHETYSCDLLDADDGETKFHHKGDIFKFIETCGVDFDLMIGHPPCTYLSNSSVSALHSEKKSTDKVLYGKERWLAMFKGSMFFNQLKNLPIPKICLENPIPHMYAREYIGKYTQIIQPWMFGHMETKATCLWLKGLPKLVETDNVKEAMMKLPKNQRQRLHYLPPSADRAKIRSRTYDGIGKAMAEQWGV